MCVYNGHVAPVSKEEEKNGPLQAAVVHAEIEGVAQQRLVVGANVDGDRLRSK